MAMNLLTLGLVAVAGLVDAAPSVSQYPKNAVAGNICSAAPYKQWLPLSRLPAAAQFCNRRFPLSTCTTTVFSTRTRVGATTTQTDTVVVNQASLVTNTVASATAFNTTTIPAPPVIRTTTATTTETQVICYNQTSAPGGFGSTPSATPTSTSPSQAKRWTGPHALLDDGNLIARAAGLSPKARSSLQRRLSSVRALATGRPAAKKSASTICGCIRANPTCTTASRTTAVTVDSTVFTTTTVTETPVVTRNITVVGTLTIFSTVTTGTPVTINSFVNITSTTYVSGCGGTTTPAGGADLSSAMASSTTMSSQVGSSSSLSSSTESSSIETSSTQSSSSALSSSLSSASSTESSSTATPPA
ncbi:hypothetical protein CAC42_7454 [Sphaceloma murrayae]|uniref:Uncharacterized protein n=1 Tax=Sphaceloma murrayae TaxID=2082308 RepID=A0A2K1QXB6_9PEZI|nr:hypothetical protein CAC42_7454 [Sphaceloma murrayae]